MSDYRLVWSTVSHAVDEEGQQLRQEKSRRLQQFYNDKWKAANKQVGLLVGWEAGALIRACAAGGSGLGGSSRAGSSYLPEILESVTQSAWWCWPLVTPCVRLICRSTCAVCTAWMLQDSCPAS
jgi:hypothetical protein